MWTSLNTSISGRTDCKSSAITNIYLTIEKLKTEYSKQHDNYIGRTFIAQKRMLC